MSFPFICCFYSRSWHHKCCGLWGEAGLCAVSLSLNHIVVVSCGITCYGFRWTHIDYQNMLNVGLQIDMTRSLLANRAYSGCFCLIVDRHYFFCAFSLFKKNIFCSTEIVKNCIPWWWIPHGKQFFTTVSHQQDNVALCCHLVSKRGSTWKEALRIKLDYTACDVSP